MYYGSYQHSLDDKGRLLLPSKLRAPLGNKAFLIKGYEGSLSLYDEAGFKEYIDSLTSLPYSHKDARDIKRIALSSVYELELDKVGRLLLPSALLSKYAISKRVVVVGLIDHIEIWDEDKWNEYLKSTEDRFEDISENLSL